MLLRYFSMLFCSASGCLFGFQAEDGIRALVRSRGLGDVYKRQASDSSISSVRSPPFIVFAAAPSAEEAADPSAERRGIEIAMEHVPHATAPPTRGDSQGTILSKTCGGVKYGLSLNNI